MTEATTTLTRAETQNHELRLQLKLASARKKA